MIAEKGQTYKKCAAVIHVSPQTFTKKMHGSSMFGIEEANNLGDFLGMNGTRHHLPRKENIKT